MPDAHLDQLGDACLRDQFLGRGVLDRARDGGQEQVPESLFPVVVHVGLLGHALVGTEHGLADLGGQQSQGLRVHVQVPVGHQRPGDPGHDVHQLVCIATGSPGPLLDAVLLLLPSYRHGT